MRSHPRSLFPQRHYRHGQTAQGHFIAAKLTRGRGLGSDLLIHHVKTSAGSAGHRYGKGAVALVHQQHLMLSLASDNAQGVNVGLINESVHKVVTRPEVVVQKFEHPVASIGLSRLPIHHGHRRELCGVPNEL